MFSVPEQEADQQGWIRVLAPAA